MITEMTYSISIGDIHVYLSESPEHFLSMVETMYLNSWLITQEALDALVGYLAVTYPNVTIETQIGSTAFLKYVEVPNQD